MTAPRRVNGERIRTVVLLLVVLAVGWLAVTVVSTKISANRAGQQAQSVADPVGQLCARSGQVSDVLHREGLCRKAAEVVQSPAVSVPPATETVEAPSARGVQGTDIVGGHLLISYTDGTTRDVGPVVGTPGAPGAIGPTGPDGAEGPAGRGVQGTEVVDGRLVLTYSDDTTEDVGVVVGPTGARGADGGPGRGVTSVAAADGRLVVTYSDGTTQDAGPLPAGPPGRGVQRAEVVDCRWRVTYTDGATEDAGNACTTQTVTPTPTPTTTPTFAPTTDAPPLLPPTR